MKKRAALFFDLFLFFVIIYAAGITTHAASHKLPRAKITHIDSYDWTDYNDFFKEEGEIPKYVYYDDGSYNDYEGYYVKRIDITCRKEKGNVGYQFAWKEGKGKWQYCSIGKYREFMIYDIPKNIVVSVKVRTYKDIKGKRYYGKWSPVVKETTHDKEVHSNDVYTKDRYVKGYIKGAFKGETILVKIGKKKYTATIKNTSKKYKFKIRIGKHSPGQKIKILLYSRTGDCLYTQYNIRMYYARKIAKGFTKNQVKWTDNWGLPDSSASGSGGWSYWYYDDGSYIGFKNGKVRYWYYVN